MVTWNCNDVLRNKVENSSDHNFDLHIIQECENP
jgi:hypothetical protein